MCLIFYTVPKLPKMARDTLLATRQYLDESLNDDTGLTIHYPL